MRVALVSDQLFCYGGAERVVEQIIALFPAIDLYALVDFIPQNQRGFLRGKAVETSFIQRLPLAAKYFRGYLPLWPAAVEAIPVKDYDVVISSHHSVSHGVITRPDQVHICYTHSPMRYAWDRQDDYFRGPNGGALSVAVKAQFLKRLRQWDVTAGQRPDRIISNSAFVASRVSKYYRRSSQVINPPVYVDEFQLNSCKEDYYLYSGRLVSYKRIDLLVEAFKELPGRRLIVAGDGPELARLKAAAPPNVTFIGYTSSKLQKILLSSAKAFLFAGVEDFGISPLEAQASGTPVIAFEAGGVRETIRGLDHQTPTGVLFRDQNAAGLVAAIELFERVGTDISPSDCRANAVAFDPAHFRARFLSAVEGAVARHRQSPVPIRSNEFAVAAE
jgi:glycosyltransferase involved in cell wall biosynthesis